MSFLRSVQVNNYIRTKNDNEHSKNFRGRFTFYLTKTQRLPRNFKEALIKSGMQIAQTDFSCKMAENMQARCVPRFIQCFLRYIGRTIILAAITLTVLFVCAWNMTTVFLGIILAPAFICYVHGSFIIRIFQNLEETKGQTESEPI